MTIKAPLSLSPSIGAYYSTIKLIDRATPIPLELAY